MNVVMAAVTDLSVDVGGRNLHVVRSGHGSPAVILEAGAGCWSEHWRAVQELTGALTATYSYDRAGHGTSEPDDPWSLEGWLADLEAWLAAGQVPPPYLLAGHSLGAHIVRALAARHPADVAGLILVDARPEDLYPELPEAFLARLAELAPDDAQRASHADEIVRQLPGLAALPLSVITHGRADWIPGVFGLDQADRDQAELAWQRHQRDLAARSSQSRLRVASASGHMIPIEQPDLVASEIRSMIVPSRRPDKRLGRSASQ
jgi:pimeloyl-ACP methyl ester carboxylesterase